MKKITYLLINLVLVLAMTNCESKEPQQKQELDPTKDYTETVKGVELEMVAVKGGSFTYGIITPNDSMHLNTNPCQVYLSDYLIGKTEITQEQYLAVMGSNPSYYIGKDLPVETVSWEDAKSFCNKLTELTGHQYDLPSNAQWEYAARGGIHHEDTRYAGSNDLNEVGWSYNSAEERTHRVATKKPNALGIYDLTGNVAEWISNYGVLLEDINTVNPHQLLSDKFDYIRGCDYSEQYIVTGGNSHKKGMKNSRIGFRVVLLPGQTNSVVSSFGLNYSEIELASGGVNLQLMPTSNVVINTPELVTWTSSNPEIASVDANGNITTGNAIGQCTITATYHPANSQPLSAECVVKTIDAKKLIDLVWVEGGSFQLGDSDPSNIECYPAHNVTLSSYYMGVTEVTQKQFLSVMGYNPSNSENPTYPVNSLKWTDIQTFCAKLSEITGEQYQLPSEAQWEYAARGGKLQENFKYAGDNNPDEVGWFMTVEKDKFNNIKPIYRDTPYPVAQKKPNALGIYDMSGNVEEICQDWFANYTIELQTNPTGPANGYDKVVKGGHFNTDRRHYEISDRNHYYICNMDEKPIIYYPIFNTVGFRVVKIPQ